MYIVLQFSLERSIQKNKDWNRKNLTWPQETEVAA